MSNYNIRCLAESAISNFAYIIDLVSENNPIYILLDRGVANVLAMQILAHGSSYEGHRRISQERGVPKNGGAKLGSTHICRKVILPWIIRFLENILTLQANNGGIDINEIPEIDEFRKEMQEAIEMPCSKLENYFFVFKDSEAKTNRIILLLLPKMHSMLCEMSHYYYSKSKIRSMRFKFDDRDVDKYFENDDEYSGKAYQTKRVIERSRLGILGSLRYGLNKDIIMRARKHPDKVFMGMAQLICAYGKIF